MYDKEKTRELIDSIDILSFLSSYCNMQFRKTGINRYVWKDHDSFVVIPDGEKRSWHWNSRNIHGRNVLDYLMRVEQLDFAGAMKIIRGETKGFAKNKTAEMTSQPRIDTDDEMILPLNAFDSKTLISYLSDRRGIDKDIILSLIKDKRVYLDRGKNCVFVNYDVYGRVSFYQKRSINGKFIRSGGGVKGGYGFSVAGKKDPSSVYVYEAPIDLMSHADIRKQKGEISSWDDNSMVALCGAGINKALDYFLDTHEEPRRIIFCLDNDDAGRRFTSKYIEMYAQKGYDVSFIVPENKDFNDDLIEMRDEKRREIENELDAVFEKDEEKTEEYEKSIESNDAPSL